MTAQQEQPSRRFVEVDDVEDDLRGPVGAAS